jgi:glycosyltransferase involved in cell wall biosynthesis
VVELLGKDPALAQATLLIVGDGPGIPDLLARARNLGVEGRVHVAGLVERDSLAPYIATFDVALQPEVTPYASPLKLFEYMALNRAIVAPDAPNIREVLTDGTDALLFKPYDPGSLAGAVRTLALDPALRARIGRGAANKIMSEDMTWARNARRAISLIESHQGAKG